MTLETPPITLSELSRRYGSMPASRVHLERYPATEDDVLEMNDKFDRRCELKDGLLVEKTMGLQESFIAIEIAGMLREFVRKHKLGIVTGEGGMMRLDLGLVRIPDVAFVSWDQFPDRKVPRTPIPDIYPELAVEVLSVSNTEEEMEEKLDDYFTAGTSLVWIVDPETKTVRVYTSRKRSRLSKSADTLDGGKALPGLKLPVKDIFAGI